MNDFEQAELRYFSLLIDAGCKIKFRSMYFGKEYVWFTGPDGTLFLEKMPNEEVDLEPING